MSARDKGRKGYPSKKEFSKSGVVSRVRTPKPPLGPISASPRFNRTEKSDNNYSILLNEYEIKEVFYQDPNETIYVVQKKSNNKTYLAKICTKLQFQDYFLNQISILIGFQHPTIVHFDGFSFNDFDDQGHVTYLISHYKCILSSILFGKSSQANYKDYQSTDRQISLIGIARGMHLLHQRGIIHKQLNANHIYIDKQNQPKILGFGSSKSEQNFYSAPETILSNIYSTKTDVYSFGILMYEIISNCKAYSRNKADPKTIKIKIVNENYRPVIFFKMKNSLKNLMTRCWSAEPSQRPDFKEIFEKLCQLEEDDLKPKSKLPPLKKDGNSDLGSDPEEEQIISYCLDDEVDKDEVKSYIRKVLVDARPADLDKNFDNNRINNDNDNNDNNNNDDNNNKKIKSLEEKIAELQNQISLLNDQQNNHESIIINDKKELQNTDSITIINEEFIKNLLNITSFVIPNSVVILESKAFKGCESLKDITIPPSVKIIGDNSFENCISLEKIEISDSVLSLGTRAFINCIKLKDVTLSNSLTKINKETFSSCESLEKLVIPDSVSKLGKNIFNQCKSLNNVILSPNINKIKEKMFLNCTSLKSIKTKVKYQYQLFEQFNIPPIGKFKYNTFEEYESLEIISIPSPIKTIEYNAFEGRESLSNIYIPSTIKTIEDNAFEGCESLRNIYIPSSMKKIGNNVFNKCSKLLKIIIDSLKTSIKNDAFNGLSSLEEIESKTPLTSVKIPLSAEKINEEKDFHLCISCQQIIKEDDENFVQFSGFYYHKNCMKCSICHKKVKSIYMENFEYFAPGLFLCEDHYDKKEELNGYTEIKEEYKEKLIYISIKELFSLFSLQPLNSSKYFYMDQNLDDISFKLNKNFEYFVPTVTFHFKLNPEEIDFSKLVSLLPEEMIITSVEKGSTLLTLAIIVPDDVNDLDECQKIIDSFISKSLVTIVGNIIDKPEIKIPTEEKQRNILKMHIIYVKKWIF